MQIKKKIQQHRDFKLLKDVLRAYNNDDHQKMLELTSVIIFSDDEEINRNNRDFWYYKAIALDMNNQSIDAMTIFRRLVTLYPDHPSYLNSFKIVCSRVQGMAYEVFEKDPTDPVLLKYFSLFYDMWDVPYYLYVAWAKSRIVVGAVEEAREKMMALLDLSPGDAEYLRYNLELALESGNEEWIKQVNKKILRLVRKYPSRFELYPLLPSGFC